MDLDEAIQTMITTKSSRGGLFLEQLDIYHRGRRVALVAGFSDDAERRLDEMFTVVTAFGADEVFHGAEAWVHKLDADGTRRTVEALIALHVTMDDATQAIVEFNEVGDSVVFGSMETSFGVEGRVLDAIRAGLSLRAEKHVPDPRRVAQAVMSYGLACILP